MQADFSGSTPIADERIIQADFSGSTPIADERIIQADSSGSTPIADAPSTASPREGAALTVGSKRETLIAALALAALALLFRLPSYPRVVVNWDESLYLIMAQQWLQGGLPYVAVWDHHPIGVPALFAIAQWLFGPDIVVIRLITAAAITATALLLHHFVRSGGAGGLQALAAGVLYIAYTVVDGGLAANTEVFFIPFVAFGFATLAGEARYLAATGKVRLGPAVAAGLAFGIGLQCKYVIICEALAPLTALAWLAWRRGAAHRRIVILAMVFALALALPTIAAAGYFAASGHFTEFFQANFLANLRYVSLSGGGMDPSIADIVKACLKGLLPLAPLAAVIGLAMFYARRNLSGGMPEGKRRCGVTGWAWLWLGAAALDVIWPQKFFDHYFLVLVAPLSLLAATGLARLVGILLERRLGAHGVVIAVIALATIPAQSLMPPGWLPKLGLTPSFGTIQAEPPAIVARHISARLKPGAAIYVANDEPVIYYLTGAAIPTRFAFPPDLTTGYSRILPVEALAEIRGIFDRQPQFVVRRRFSHGTEPSAALALVDTFLARDYRPDCVVARADGLTEIYRRAPREPAVATDIEVCR